MQSVCTKSNLTECKESFQRLLSNSLLNLNLLNVHQLNILPLSKDERRTLLSKVPTKPTNLKVAFR